MARPTVRPFRLALLLAVPMTLAGCGDGTSSGGEVPSRIVVVEGGGQSGEAGLALAGEVVVEVRNSAGSGLGEVSVSFSPSGGGGAQPASTLTDAAGRARTSWTLGTAAGEQTLTVGAGELTSSVAATALPGAPAAMEKSGGDAQSGEPGSTLEERLEVTVRDVHGNPVAQVPIAFEASAGSVSPGQVSTDAQGRARTTLTLPEEETTVTVRAEGPDLAAVVFDAVAEQQPLRVATSALPDGRRTVQYGEEVRASGGSGSGHVFEVASGSLPPGLELTPAGVLQGTPTSEGSYGFVVGVVDDEGGEATGEVSLRICGPPFALAPGESAVMTPAAPGECGLFLPAGNDGDRYRIGVVRATSTISAGDVQQVRLRVTGRGVAASPPATTLGAVGLGGVDPLPHSPALAAALRRAARVGEATAAVHLEMRERERELLRTLGSDAVLTEGGGRPSRVPAAQGSLPDRIRADTVTSSCTQTSSATFLKIGEDARLAVYQDSAQNASGSGARISATQVQGMLDFYRDHGKEVVDRYFGGVSDIDGNGKIIVLVTPVVKGNVAAFVWGGDFFAASGSRACRTSNEGEYIYFNAGQIRDLTVDPPSLAYQVLVHEAKHVSSVYQRMQHGSDDVQLGGEVNPGFVEEGVAEIAGEVAVRRAWAARGGPAVHDRLVEQHWRDDGQVDNVTVGLAFMLFRTQEYLASQPNAVVIDPAGARSGHSVYGAGWTFHRWLGDAYGGAGSGPMADSALFRRLNHRGTPPGIAGITEVTGESWTTLLEEYAVAAMANGQDVSRPERAYTGYDFRSAIELFCFAVDFSENCSNDTSSNPRGSFPWPVTTGPDGGESRDFRTASYIGPIGPAGLRVHDFLSNGTGQGAEIHVEGPSDLRMAVLRLR